MNTDCELISAFIDDEPVHPEDLLRALASEEGRAFFIDALLLRRLTQSNPDAIVVPVPKSSFRRRLAVAAAITLTAMASFQLGRQRGVDATMRAPEPTRVISAGPAWQEESAIGDHR